MPPPDGDRSSPAGRDTPPKEGNWTKINAVLAALGVLVAIYAVTRTGSTPPNPADPPPSTAPVTTPVLPPDPTPSDVSRTPTPGVPTVPRRSIPPTVSGPTLAVTPFVVDFGERFTIAGAGFEGGSGVQIRLFHDDSISYQLGGDVIIDENGGFTIGGPASNPGWCGSGTIAAFAGSASAIEVPDFSEAIATANVGIRC